MSTQQQQYFQDTSLSADNLDLFSDIVFSQNQQQQQQQQLQQQSQSQINQPQQIQTQHHQQQTQSYNFPTASRLLEQHSNSSNETLVGSGDNTSHFGSNDSIPNSLLIQQQQQQSHHQHHQGQQTPTEEQEGKLYFDRTSASDLGPLSLRSNSDPTIALHSLQSRQQTTGLTDISQSIPLQQLQLLQQQQQQHQLQQAIQSQNLSAEAQSSLPSFQETYPIKHNQLATLGLKMDEECYNIVPPHHPNMGYHHHGHGHHPMHQDTYDYQQNTSQFISPSFYPYEQNTMVSFI